LQNLANNTQFGGLKEFYMAPLNNFLSGIKDKLNTFLEDLTRVDNLDDHLQVKISFFFYHNLYFNLARQISPIGKDT
jgi:hypothetical protein